MLWSTDSKRLSNREGLGGTQFSLARGNRMYFIGRLRAGVIGKRRHQVGRGEILGKMIGIGEHFGDRVEM